MFKAAYKQTPGAKGLITYEKDEIVLKNKIIDIWTRIFIEPSTEYIDAPTLVPLLYLQQSGHLAQFNKSNNEIYRIALTPLALRPETCTSIFAYYLAKYGKRAVTTDIAQVGKSYRNEKSTRGLEFRLNEFYQLQYEQFRSTSICDEIVTIDGLQMYSSMIALYKKSITFFNTLGIPVTYHVLPKAEAAFYSLCTVDIMLKLDNMDVELGCINHRATNDISNTVSVVESSIGLHRLIVVLSKYIKSTI